MKNIIIALLAIASLTGVQAQTNERPNIEEEYYTMISNRGTLQFFNSLTETIVEEIRKTKPNIHADTIQAFKDAFNEGIKKVAIKTLVPSYQELLTIKEVRSINKFYTTDAGKKLLAISPQLSLGVVKALKSLENTLKGIEEQTNPDPDKKVEEEYCTLVSNTGALQPFQSIIGMLHQQLGANANHEMLSQLKNELDKGMKKTAVKELAPIYQKSLTAKEAKEINKFYATDSGKKLVTTTPATTQAFIGLFQYFGESIGELTDN